MTDGLELKNLSPLSAFRFFANNPPFICCNLSLPCSVCVFVYSQLRIPRRPPSSHTMIGNQVTDWLAAEGELRLGRGRGAWGGRELPSCSNINRAGKDLISHISLQCQWLANQLYSITTAQWPHGYLLQDSTHQVCSSERKTVASAFYTNGPGN